MTENKSLKLQLGDIIEIGAPNNEDLNKKVFYIDYIDTDMIRLINTSTLSIEYLNIENDSLSDESIENISILSREDEKGYARQNALRVNTWVEIKFGGDVPTIIVAEITDLQEDMIELTTYPEKDVLYIDFAYKGIPLDIPIEEINIREKPKEELRKETSEVIKTIEDDDTKEESEKSIIEQPEITLELPKQEIEDQLKNIFEEADNIVFGSIDNIQQKVNVDEEEKRFSLEEQTNDLLDEMLSTVPNVERTNKVLSKIHLMIERFTQLRKLYSTYDKDNNISGMLRKTSSYKPLVKSLKSLEHNLYWLLPIVKNKKEILDVVDEGEREDVILSLNEDVIPSSTEKFVINMHKSFEKYKESQYSSGNNYSTFMNEILQELNNRTEPLEDSIISNVELSNTSLNVVLDNVLQNLQDFYSSVYKNDTIRKQRFVISKYNLGLNMLKADELRGSYMKSRKIKLTNPDKIPIKGFMTMPQTYVQLSKINLPGTTIYDKTNLNHAGVNYWNFLKRQTSLVKQTIDNMDETNNYDGKNFIENVKAYVLSDEFTNSSDPVVKQRTYERFLEIFIPTTQELFQTYKSYLKNGLSIDKIIKQMEPFLVYRDDLTFKQYQDMRDFIEENILKLKQQVTFNSKDTNLLRNLKTKVKFANGLLTLLLDIKKSEFINTYDLKSDVENFDSVVYSKLMHTDYGNFYNILIQDLTKDLYVNIDIDATLKDTITGLDGRIKEEDSKECNTRKLVKTYFSLEELNNDDNTENVHYDRKYDETRYDFIEEYKAEQELLEPEEFEELLTKKLREIVGMNEENAKEEAYALINGRRKIQNGNYAILIHDGDKYYYVRKDNKWVLDNSLSGNEDLDDSTLFCNTSEKCIKIKDECLSLEDSKEKLMKQSVEKISKTIESDSQNYTESLQKRIENYSNLLTQIIALKSVLKLRTNNMFYKYGMDASQEGIVVSPYAELVQIILSQRDFAKKMNDINRFINAFTRKYNDEDENESQYWYYCNKTNTKLLPTFYGKISNAFILKEDFTKVLDEICAVQGEISDDGDKWVDKYSGYTIRMIELSTEEGYDESGYATTTRAVMENIGDEILKGEPLTSEEIYNTKEAISISNILNALALYTGIQIKEKEQMIKGILTYSMKQIGSKEKYEKKVKAAELKGKKIIKYEDKRNQYFLFFSGLYFLIFTQTSVPSLRTRKTFPGCIKSFSGFPYENNGDTSGLKYVACIMKKISSSEKPWNSIKGIGESSLVKNMQIIYNKILSADTLISQRIADKFESVEKGEDEDFIPDDVDVSNWTTFLPPLKPVDISVPKNISSEIKTKLNSSLKSGSFKQIPILSMIQGKIIYFSLSIQKEIEKIVNKEDTLLQTNSGVPFIENVCCHNDIDKTTLDFFTDKSSNIKQYDTIIRELRELYNNTIKIANSSILVDVNDTKLKYPKISNDFGEKTIYQGFIQYCKINKEEPIDDAMKIFCHDKTSEFNKDDSLSEKIKILRREGKDYDNEMFIELLNAVNRQRVLTINFDTIIPKSHEKLTYILNNLKSKIDEENANVPSKLIESLEKLLSMVGLYTQDVQDDTKKLLNYLLKSTESMKKNIITYISEHSNFKRSVKKQISEFVKSIDEFEPMKKTSLISKDEATDIKLISYLKNCLYHMIYEYPNIILNKVDYSNINVHTHWKLSDIHKKDIKQLVKKNYESLKPFYGNSDLKPLLIEIQYLTKDIVDLIENTPLNKSRDDGTSEVFNNKLVKQLYIFYFFSVIEKYIELENLVMDEEYAVLKEEIDVGMEYADDEYEMMREKQEKMETLEGNKLQVQRTLSSLIGSYLLIFKRQKNRIDLNRPNILELVLRSKEKEKNVKTRQLKDLTDEERKVDSELRKAKLGQWNVGLQKGLTQYVKNFYDVERNQMEQEAIIESKLGNISDVTNMNRDIYTMDILTEEMTNMAIEEEAYDMSLLADDDDFGERDGDEQY